MLIYYIPLLLFFSLGAGLFADLPVFKAADFSQMHARAVAQSLLVQHQIAVNWVEEEDSSGARIHADYVGDVAAADPDVGGVTLNQAAFGTFPTYRIAGTLPADWATITYVPPSAQQVISAQYGTALPVESIPRYLVELSGGNEYTIGVYEGGYIEPLDASSTLAAPTDTPWSPMDNRDPSTYTTDDPRGKPASTVHWVQAGKPQVLNAPPGLVDGSWVIMTMTPSV